MHVTPDMGERFESARGTQHQHTAQPITSQGIAPTPPSSREDTMQPYQPQAYAPQQQYAPAYQPQPNFQHPSYPQVPQQPYAPTGPVGGQAMPTAAPALGTSSRTGEGGPKFPQPRHLIGRTVIFEPISIDETTKNDDGELRPTAHYHMTVVDGGPLEYGDNKSQKIADQHGLTMRTEVPARFVGCSSDRWGIVQEIRDAMARGELATVGVIVQGTKGTKGSPPFLVTRPGRNLDGSDRPDGNQRFATATAVWNEIFAKTFRSPEPVSLVAPPAQQPAQVAYQPTAPAPQHYPVPGGTAADWAASPYQQHAQPGYQPQAYAAPAPQPVSAAPANPAFEAWLATLPPEQQAQQRAAFAAQQQAQPAGPGF